MYSDTCLSERITIEVFLGLMEGLGSPGDIRNYVQRNALGIFHFSDRPFTLGSELLLLAPSCLDGVELV